MFKVKVCLLMLLCSVAAAMANPPVPVEKVKGTIKTPNGEPVIGATIIEKGTTNGTITDVNGNFVLKIMNKIGVWRRWEQNFSSPIMRSKSRN